MLPIHKNKDSNCNISNSICKTHLFQLKTIDPLNQPIPNTHLSYCPIFSQPHQQYQNIFPIFNFDHKYYSPGFVLQIDKLFNQQNQLFYKDRFDKVVEQRLIQQQTYNFNPPFKSNQFCHVCTTKYEDYLEHINDLTHKLNLRKSVANSDIQTLCQLYKQEYKLKRRRNNEIKEVHSKANRTSARLRQVQEKKKERQQGIGQISTMTSQKELKGCEQEGVLRKVKILRRNGIYKFGVRIDKKY